LLRHDAIAAVLDCLTSHEVVVLANGFISREGYSHRDVPQQFYMLGSMGLAGAIGLGVALTHPATPVVVIDGDGNLLMGLGLLPMVGAWQPSGFLHIVLDNGTYGSTGAQPTVAPVADFPALALASGYRRAVSVNTETLLRNKATTWVNQPGPSLLHVPISKVESRNPPRVRHDPPIIASRFAAAIGGTTV
jgi:thiamine pyrophosphate-dependent acetolactate synthase large subunit-like protein